MVNGTRISGDIWLTGSPSHELGKHLLLGVLHCPAWHWERSALPDFTRWDMRQVRRNSQDSPQMFGESDREGAQGGGCDTYDVLGVEGASADAGLPKADSIPLERGDGSRSAACVGLGIWRCRHECGDACCAGACVGR